MDDFGQIGPDKGDYATDCRRVAKELRDRATVFVPLAANGTRLNVVLAPKHGVALIGASPAGLVESEDPPTYWCHVAIDEKGAYWFDLLAFIAPSYLSSKYRDLGQPDGEALSDFLARLGAELRRWGWTK